MSSIPPEVKALIVSEIWLSEDPEPTLSSLSFAWPDAIHFIRECRFNDVLLISTLHRIPELIAIIEGAPEVGASIRTLMVSGAVIETGQLLHLLSSATNVEDLQLTDFPTGDNLLDTLGTCNHLTTLFLYNFSIEHFSNLLDVLRPLPNLSALRFEYFQILEFGNISLGLWKYAGMSLEYNDEEMFPWSAHGYETPRPMLQVSCLSLHLSTSSDLLLYDLICSAKTPFPNLQEIVLADEAVKSYRSERLSALMERYASSLRTLDLVDGLNDSCMSFPLIGFLTHVSITGLMLPANVEHLKFGLGVTFSMDPFWHTLSSSASLRSVTMRLKLEREGTHPHLERFDELLAGLAYLERLNIEVEFYQVEQEEQEDNDNDVDGYDAWDIQQSAFKDEHDSLVGKYLPQCAKRYENGSLAGGLQDEA